LTTNLLNHWQANSASSPSGKIAHPFNPFHPSSLGWGYILWQILFQLAVVTTWQTTIARVLAAKDEATAKRMYRRSAFYFVGRFALPGLWGSGRRLSILTTAQIFQGASTA